MRWGAGRPAYKGKAEACMRVDVRDWARRGTLKPGYQGTWSWSNSQTGEHTGSIGFCIEHDCAVLSYALNGEPRTQRIPMLRTSCNYGGSRPWFACPHCRNRVAVLYMRRGAFICRKCAQVGYYSQSEDCIGRAWRRQQKAESKLGEHWQRPKGMHEATRRRILDEIIECERMRDDALAMVLAKFGAWL